MVSSHVTWVDTVNVQLKGRYIRKPLHILRYMQGVLLIRIRIGFTVEHVIFPYGALNRQICYSFLSSSICYNTTHTFGIHDLFRTFDSDLWSTITIQAYLSFTPGRVNNLTVPARLA